jgi:mono/diheme cytochrome c family protein
VRTRAALTLAFATLALAGCDLTMTKQPKYGPQVAASLFADGTSAQAPPEGTVSQGAVADAQASAAPPPVSLALLQRGQERHGIFCKPCHGVSGEGDGVIVARGFPRPPSYQDDRVRTASPQHLFQVITNGYGVMYPYAERVPPADRWAIIAYIRALEVARDQGAPDVHPPKGSYGGPA